MTIGTDGSLTEEGSDTTGTFTYKKQLEVGDQVAIYSGDVIPTMDMSSGDNSDVSFIEITGADWGQVYISWLQTGRRALYAGCAAAFYGQRSGR